MKVWCLLFACLIGQNAFAQDQQSDRPTESKEDDPFERARKDVERITVLLDGKKQLLHPKPHLYLRRQHAKLERRFVMGLGSEGSTGCVDGDVFAERKSSLQRVRVVFDEEARRRHGLWCEVDSETRMGTKADPGSSHTGKVNSGPIDPDASACSSVRGEAV